MRNTRLLKYHDMEAKVLENYNVAPVASVTLNNVMFADGVISKIEILKHIAKDGSDNLFINLYMGNINVATVVTNDDYVIEVEDDKYPSYWIRKAKEYDY
ncbi:hypothetical protein [Clostridium lundense]|uniref:hypothetical protein n=1 Tax=Clostridium lundense TaxID=319475 RepID=UPI0004803C6C|nr:hypothetical protein [Clostridium lundense]